MTEIVANCPFCGGSAQRRNHIGNHYMMCERCHAQTGYWTSEQEAKHHWNRRPSPAVEATRIVDYGEGYGIVRPKQDDIASPADLGVVEALAKISAQIQRMRSIAEIDGPPVLMTGELDLLEKRLATARAALAASRPATHRHKKRGTLYTLIGKATLQCDTYSGHDGSNSLYDEQEMTLYRGEDDKLWVRSTEEFEDGRFEALSASPSGMERGK